MKVFSIMAGAFIGSIGVHWTAIEYIEKFHEVFYKEHIVPLPIFYIFLIHSLILVLIVYLLYNKFNNSTIDISGNELFMYQNQQEAEADILQDMEISKNIDIFTMRGHSFILPERAFGRLSRIDRNIRFCVSNPKTQKNPNPYIIDRAKETENTTPESYWNDLNNDKIKIKEIMKKNKNFKSKLHLVPATFRIFIFDDNMYFSFFEPFVSGSKLPIYKVNNNTGIYIGFKRFFEKIWKESKELK